MTDLKNYPYRILIVDDENRDWANPMREALEDAADDAGFNNIQLDIAFDGNSTKHKLAQQPFHIVSLDMRLPENKGEAVTFDTGVKLAKSFTFIGFPKVLIYSQSLRDIAIKQDPSATMTVLKIAMDSYAKPTGSEADKAKRPVETLSKLEWAKRLIDYLQPDQLRLTEPKQNNALLPEYETLLGAYFHYGVLLLPPVLAKHLQELENVWQTKDARRNDAAIKFIETTARLALAQCAVLSEQAIAQVLPKDERVVNCLNALQTVLPSVANANFSNYLNQDAITAFREALKERNNVRYSLTVNNPSHFWAELRVPLQYAMDVAAFWVRHPLCIDLGSRRDGWNAELLAGTSTPRKRYPLPESIDFPNAVFQDNLVWQHIWLLSPHEPEPIAIHWGEWLIADSRSERAWWLLIHQQNNQRVYLDLDSGNTKTL